MALIDRNSKVPFFFQCVDNILIFEKPVYKLNRTTHVNKDHEWHDNLSKLIKRMVEFLPMRGFFPYSTPYWQMRRKTFPFFIYFHLLREHLFLGCLCYYLVSFQALDRPSVYYWKCNFPVTRSWGCPSVLNGRELTLSCSYQNTCLKTKRYWKMGVRRRVAVKDIF